MVRISSVTGDKTLRRKQHPRSFRASIAIVMTNGHGYGVCSVRAILVYPEAIDVSYPDGVWSA